jgi:hypothetical protein
MKISRKDIRKILKELTASEPCNINTSPPDQDIFLDVKEFVKKHGGCGISDRTVEQIAYGYALNRLLPLQNSLVSDEMARIQSEINNAVQNGLRAALAIKKS